MNYSEAKKDQEKPWNSLKRHAKLVINLVQLVKLLRLRKLVVELYTALTQAQATKLL